MRKAKGYIDRFPIGADPTRYRPGIKKEREDREAAKQRKWDAMTEEQKAARRKEWADYMEDMAWHRKNVDELGSIKAMEMFNERRAQRRAMEKLVDREARAAVEGDTDLNHDNLEPSK